jgi:membrane protein insertase Oxa1/YidC/SpoIIIJ
VPPLKPGSCTCACRHATQCTAAPQILIKALPLMIGWFALNLPSGLGLYYLSNTVLTTGQQLFLRKYSGEHG